MLCMPMVMHKNPVIKVFITGIFMPFWVFEWRKIT
ncbi:hypothetical protein EF10244_14730 [Enterococcus faecalis 10244]|nr:hypothetical protein EF10244_14730 [Enterococcus faecalis 10244]